MIEPNHHDEDEPSLPEHTEHHSETEHLPAARVFTAADAEPYMGGHSGTLEGY